MRITRQIADQVSTEMLAKKSEKLDQLNDLLAKELRTECLKTIPSDILDLYLNYPDCFTTTSNCYIDGYPHKIGEYLPSVHGNSFKILQTDKIKHLIKQKFEKKKELNQLKRETYTVVLSAKTLNNLKKIMPKAVDFIKVESDLLLPAVNIENLMNRIESE